MNKSVIIVAGGTGKRMGSAIPKQFLVLGHKPILMHCIECFYKYSPDIQIIVVLPDNQTIYWKKLCVEFSFSIKHTVVAGGETRFQSVKNGLTHSDIDGLVAIHDGVRPFVSKETISKAFNAAEVYGNAIPCILINESIRIIENKSSFPVDRDKIRIIQTPQVFKSDIVIKAYNEEYRNEFTDDASVLEWSGEKIHLIDGNKENIKITDVTDFQFAELIFKNNQL
ncbi:MAG: 2-C-methyl-D-erythritol 4-phosphate cytidylyltransferase [Bacteroidota bacterium]